jgi:hypothetical protein
MRNVIYYIQDMSQLGTVNDNQVLNIGQILSNAYIGDKAMFLRKIRVDSAEYFKKLITSQLKPAIPRLVFTNIGMLQEPQFALNAARFLVDYTIDNTVVLYWPYFVKDGNTLSWNDTYKNSIKFENTVSLERMDT